jgi:DNA-binding NtrC family response regulator
MMTQNSPHTADCNHPGNHCATGLSIAMIAPDEARRATAVQSAAAICDVSAFLSIEQAKVSQSSFDVIMIDIDGDTDQALNLVSDFSSDDKIKVLVYSSDINPEKLARSMCAGARDFLAFPFGPKALAEALNRLSAPRTSASSSADVSEFQMPAASRAPLWRRLFDYASMART